MQIIAEPSQKPHGLGNLLSQIVIGTTGTKPDFNVEEKASIEKDTRELRQIIREMADYLPREDPEKGESYVCLFGISLRRAYLNWACCILINIVRKTINCFQTKSGYSGNTYIKRRTAAAAFSVSCQMQCQYVIHEVQCRNTPPKLSFVACCLSKNDLKETSKSLQPR